MIKLYLFERNVFTAIFFTPLSQQSETQKSTKMRFFMKVYIQMGGGTGNSEGKNLGSKGPPRYIQPRPLTWRALALRKRLRIRSEISVNYHYITVLCPFNLLNRFKCYNTVLIKFKQI